MSHLASRGLHLSVPAALASCTYTQTATGPERWCWRRSLDIHTHMHMHAHTHSPCHSWTSGHAGIVIRVRMTLFAVYSSCGLAARWLGVVFAYFVHIHRHTYTQTNTHWTLTDVRMAFSLHTAYTLLHTCLVTSSLQNVSVLWPVE